MASCVTGFARLGTASASLKPSDLVMVDSNGSQVDVNLTPPEMPKTLNCALDGPSPDIDEIDVCCEVPRATSFRRSFDSWTPAESCLGPNRWSHEISTGYMLMFTRAVAANPGNFEKIVQDKRDKFVGVDSLKRQRTGMCRCVKLWTGAKWGKKLLNCFGQLQSAWGSPTFDSFALVLQEVEQVGITNRFCVRQTIFQGGSVWPSGPLFCSAKAAYSEAFEFREGRQYRMPFLSPLPFPEGPKNGADFQWCHGIWGGHRN